MTQIANAQPNIAGSEWGLAQKPERFIQFRDGEGVSGHAGCNRFFGTYKLEWGNLNFGPLGATKKLCQPDLMDAERAFFAALEKTEKFKLSENRSVLKLFSAEDELLMELQHRDWD